MGTHTPKTKDTTADTVTAGVPPEFAAIFRELVMAIQPRPLEPETCRVYYDTLQGFPLDVLREAMQRLRHRASNFFPAAGEWFAAAVDVQQDRLAALAQLPAPRHQVCDACEDTGWVYHQCPGDSTCGRHKPHLGHSYVTACPCRATNVEYQRRQAIARRGGGS